MASNKASKRNARNSRHELTPAQVKLIQAISPADAPKIAESFRTIFEVSAFSSAEEAVTPGMRDCLADLYFLIPVIEAVGKEGVR